MRGNAIVPLHLGSRLLCRQLDRELSGVGPSEAIVRSDAHAALVHS
jgi:hypothetical protein